MKFSCEKYLLQEAVASCSRVVPSHATIEILKGILIKTENGGVVVTGNNLELVIVSRIEAEVISEGSCVLEAKMLFDIVRKLPEDQLTLEVDDKFMARITCGLSDFNISALSSESYPSLPEVKSSKNITVSQPSLKRQINQTVFSVSESESKLIHTGALFDIEDGALTLVALDGHRLSYCRQPISAEENYSFVVPASSLREVERMLSEQADEEVSVDIGLRHIVFDLGQITVMSRLLEGEFLKYKTAIPKNCPIKFTANTKELISSIERVSLLINEKLKNPIRLAFNKGSIKIHCVSSLGKASDICSCEGGEELEIGFNHRYVIDALRRIESENVKIEMSGALLPCLFLPDGEEDSLFMVLPVRLKSD